MVKIQATIILTTKKERPNVANVRLRALTAMKKEKIVKVYVGTNNLEIDDGKWIERKKNSRPIDSKGQQMGEHQSSPILGAR